MEIQAVALKAAVPAPTNCHKTAILIADYRKALTTTVGAFLCPKVNRIKAFVRIIEWTR